ncbi:2-hydroxy-3-oxopropionate reductase (Tartronate semialdehyde reductase) (TSAR) [Cupriavidus taiwanensis]|uniref:2-hydroxy-3-oxopropionate reductase n=1 Tax=Cupriavidus taiwanensis TaxID=164546 RepID=UPI000E16692F|nr:2-hydroxy-3-oxopropionate reductase [Cupriavidus taiwanensis]SOZ18132.1 2-hydroxy-3-oxopropionate reductase (Tartronate semialdehyde reductase) (TSAR) [Cupriavidus taiwanensis]SOZ31094.1 2-hydroxy-3-oxopropionate reductase (Tartronate semialdehyde reductase) (TSAR) [Cupriavidus taiwanensis]SOZ47171.1 2-hydroxy-3-oxopropionate reductase (Tartronate semialdehyde reductase) (TSAR) [Cupriavidus taiwanensis]SPA18209.1 2-hydroxy-3-oxopropionate reductase (Tartronate semialdehyde reductase) (TSAR) 
MSKIGFIGLGVMGKPMVRHLVDGGHSVFAHSRSGVPQDLQDAGVKACASAEDVARQSETIILMLPDTPDVEKVLFGERGVADGLADTAGGVTVIDMSSISPIATREFARCIEAIGADYIDAPVSGGEVGARAGTLSIMAGGKQEVFDRVLPILQLMGKNITRVGAAGDGQVAKVANQVIVALTIEAVGEALVLAARAGADPARVREALMGGFASSRILEVHGERMIRRTFDPGFRIALHQKDLELALSTARELGVGLPNTASCQQLFNVCNGLGGAAWDHSGLVRAIEHLSSYAIGDTGETGNERPAG